MDELTAKMMEHICDNLCRHPRDTKSLGVSQEMLELICSECKMGKFVCDILNFEKSKPMTNLDTYMSDIDRVAENICSADDTDSICHAHYDENDEIVCPQDMKCKDCVKKWLLSESDQTIEIYANEDKKCECRKCELADKCQYKGKYQRLPRTVPGALGLCKKL